MKSIKIVFNKNAFTESVLTDSICLKSTFDVNAKFYINSSIKDIEFSNRRELMTFFEKIRGADTNKLKLVFYESNHIEWAKANFYEQQAFRSLVLIYHWLDLSISNPDDLDVKKIFYNEFIVDWNYIPGSQNTIFLIPNKYTDCDETNKYLDKLTECNLLCKVLLILEKELHTNYYIPLLTPGVSKEYFKSEFDENGSKTNELWKRLLIEKDLRLKSWVNNRF